MSGAASADSPIDEKALEEAVAHERLLLMLRQMDIGVLGMWVTAIPIAAALLTLPQAPKGTLGWILAGFAVGIFRLLLRGWVRRRLPTITSPMPYVRLVGCSSWLTPIAWLPVTVAFFRFDQPLLACIIAICLFGGASAASNTLGTYLPAYVGFVTILTTGFIIRFVLLGGVVGVSFVFAAVFWIGATSTIARNVSRRWESALRTGLINEALAKHLERERKLAEAAVQAKSRFLAAASHDLRQPLHAQGLFLGALARISKSDPDSAELVARIGDTSRAMQELLDALLDISKLDAGVVVPSIRPFPLQQLFDQVRGEFAQAASGKGLTLRIVPTSVWVHGDPLLVGRIVRNLVSNAVRYTDQGKVLVGCRRGKPLRLCVLDSGVGIPETARDEIFEEFVQLDNPERDRSKGIGLGLAIVRRLSLLLGAELTLVSTEGRGTSFTLPLEQINPPATVLPDLKSAAAAREDRLRGLRVLVVDDEMLVVVALQRYLESIGCVVHAASNGDEAVSVVADGVGLDVVLVDHRLRGEETGLRVLERMDEAAGRSFPAVMITGDTAPERIREVLASGYPLLHKPVATDLLISTLNELRNGNGNGNGSVIDAE